MPYIMNPDEAAIAFGAKCGTSIKGADEGLLQVMALMLPKVEDAMNVASLTYGETTDTFRLSGPVPCYDAREPAQLYLSNGYVVISEDAPLVITDPNGNILTTVDYEIDKRYGIVTLSSWLIGKYTISYFAGFTASEEDLDATPEVQSYFEDVPEWIKGLTVVFLSLWYKSISKSLTLPQNVRYGELIAPLYAEIQTRLYMRYQRPRANMEFPIFSERTDGMLV